MGKTVFEQVRNIVSDLFLIPEEEVGPESSPDTIEMWDSMQHLNLVLAVEQTFGVQLSPADIAGMKNVGLIVELVKERLS